MSSKKPAARAEASSKRRRDDDDDEEAAAAPAISDDPQEESKVAADADEESSSSYSSEEEDDLILEGVAVRNPEVSSSSDDDDDDEDDDDEEGDDDKETKPASKPAAAAAASAKNNKAAKSSNPKKRKKKSKDDDDLLQVEFTFCDMDEKYFHGIKTLLQASSTIYASPSSALTDLMIENVCVGTVISTEGDEEGNVFGFASVLNVSTTSSSPAIQHLKDVCLQKCPTQHAAEMETVLSGKTKRPAGFLLHGRMINLPLEIVLVLHQQLVMDMDWAVEHAEGGEDERKSLDFGAFVRLAPCTSGGGSALFYKYFDDEILASHAEFTYTVDAPKAYGMDEKQLCQVIVITKTGHRDAMQELAQMIEQR